MSGAYSARDFLTNTIGNNHPECDRITIAIDVHTAFFYADVDPELFAEPPESGKSFESELREDEVWKLNKALYGEMHRNCGTNTL